MGKISKATKRTLAGLLAALMVFSSVPTQVLADELLLDTTEDTLVVEQAEGDLLVDEASQPEQDELLGDVETAELIEAESIGEEDILDKTVDDLSGNKVAVHITGAEGIKVDLYEKNSTDIVTTAKNVRNGDVYNITSGNNIVFDINGLKAGVWATVSDNSNSIPSGYLSGNNVKTYSGVTDELTDIYIKAYAGLKLENNVTRGTGVTVSSAEISDIITDTPIVEALNTYKVPYGESVGLTVKADKAAYSYAIVSVNGAETAYVIDKEVVKVDAVKELTTVDVRTMAFEQGTVTYKGDNLVSVNHVTFYGEDSEVVVNGTGVVVIAKDSADTTDNPVSVLKFKPYVAAGYKVKSVSTDDVNLTLTEADGVYTSEQQLSKNVVVTVNTEIDKSVTIKNVNENTEVEFTEGVSNNKIDNLSTVKFTVTTKDGYYFKNPTAVDVKNEKGLDATSVVPTLISDAVDVVWNGNIADMIAAKSDVTVSAQTVKPELKLYEGALEAPKVNGVYAVKYDTDYKIKVVGDGVASVTISEAGIKMPASVSCTDITDGVATLSFNAASGTTVALSVKPQDVNGQTGTAYTDEIAVKVSNRVTKADINNGKIVQDPGTVVSYNIVFTGDTDSDDFDLTDFYYEVSGNTVIDNPARDINVEPIGKKAIKVTTKSVAQDHDSAWITFYRHDSKDTEDIEIGKVEITFGNTVNTANVKFDAKSFKYTTDRYVAIDLTTDKELKGINDLYYVVTIDNVEKDATKQGSMLSKNEVVVKVDSVTGKITDTVTSAMPISNYVKDGLLYMTTTSVNEVEGTGALFDYTVKLVQKNTDGVVVNSSAVKELKANKKAKPTPTAVYATKIGLKNKKAKAYTKQSNFAIATVDFAKNVTYKEVVVELKDAAGDTKLDLSNGLTYNYDSGAIVVTEMPDVPGKYTLVVKYRAGEDDSANKLATEMAVNLIPRIASISLTAPAEVYKAPNKGVSIKVGTTLSGPYFSKPATKKVLYTLASVNGKSVGASYKDITVNKNNGTITIKKDAKVASVTIKAVANDFASNPCAPASITINIKDKADKIAELRVVQDLYTDPVSYNVLSLNGKKKDTYSNVSSEIGALYVLPLLKEAKDNETISQGSVLDTSKVEFKSSNSKVVDVRPNGELQANGLGKAKITAVTKDGGITTKSSVYVEVLPNNDNLQIKLTATGGMSQSKDGDVLSTNATYTGRLTDGFTVEVYDKTGDHRINDLASYSLKFKGVSNKYVTGHDKFFVQPNSDVTEITLSYKVGKTTVKKVYTVNNTLFSKNTIKLGSQVGVPVAGAVDKAAVSVNYAIKSDVVSNDSIVKCDFFKPIDQMSSADYLKYYDLLRAINPSVSINNGAVVINIDQNYGGAVPAGNYKLLLTFTTSDGKTALGKPVAVTLKVAKPAKVVVPKDISGAFKISVSDNYIDLNKTVVNKFRNVGEVTKVEVINARTAKGVNSFNSFFELSTADKLEKLVAKSTTDLSKFDKNDNNLVGYLRITYKVKDTGATETKEVLVKISLKK